MRVGVLGGGQLGQMLALAGHPMGIDVICYDTSPDVPAKYGGTVIAGAFDDIGKASAWTSECDIVTYEWENVPLDLVSKLAEIRPIRPGVDVLATVQDRWHEKQMLSHLGIPVAPYRLCTNTDELHEATSRIGPNVVVKTRTGGYDGKGQVVVRDGDLTGDSLLEHGDVVVEQLMEFDFELSVIVARSMSGVVVVYPVTTNVHREGILRKSYVDTALSRNHHEQAARFATLIVDHLDYVGVMALELFCVDGNLLANEIAPRVHNSGHWTIEGAETSQFENHLRAICDLPLGSTAQRCHAAMINIIGDSPGTADLLEIPGAALHTYRKLPRSGRKLGHVTVTAPNERLLRSRIEAVEEALRARENL